MLNQCWSSSIDSHWLSLACWEIFQNPRRRGQKNKHFTHHGLTVGPVLLVLGHYWFSIGSGQAVTADIPGPLMFTSCPDNKSICQPGKWTTPLCHSCRSNHGGRVTKLARDARVDVIKFGIENQIIMTLKAGGRVVLTNMMRRLFTCK